MGLEEAAARGVRKKSQLWKKLRMAVFMIRRGLLKRRTLLQEDLQVLRSKRGFKLFGSKNLQLFHRHHMPKSPRGGFGLLEHEFSFSDSSADPPVHLTKKKLMNAQHCFPCIQPNSTDESPTFSAASWLEQMNGIQSSPEEVKSMETYQLVPGDELSTSTAAKEAGLQVDREAEEFIARFYKQIKFQRQISLLQYQEMLARGAT